MAEVHCFLITLTILFWSACEAAVTGLIDLFLLGVDVDTIESALEVNKNWIFKPWQNVVDEIAEESIN